MGRDTPTNTHVQRLKVNNEANALCGLDNFMIIPSPLQ